MEGFNPNRNDPQIRMTENYDYEGEEVSRSNWVISPSVAVHPEDLQYTFFLQFLHTDNEKEYRNYIKKQIYAPAFWIFIVLIFLALSRANYYTSFTAGIIPLFAVLMHIITIMEILIYVVGRHFQTLTGRTLWSTLQTWLDFLVRVICYDELESIIAMSLTICFALTLFSRVLIGQCPGDVNIYTAVYCNPNAESNCPPLDVVLKLFLSYLMVQVFIKGVRKFVILLCWCLGFCSVLWSLAYLNGWIHTWALFFSLFFLAISYEFERTQISLFLQTKQVIQNEISKRLLMEQEHAAKQLIITQLNDVKLKEEKSRYDVEILKIQVENDAKLRELETNQLRSLMGNVAHDLKTPIHSIVMDVEMLKTNYSQLETQNPYWFKKTKAQQQQSSIHNVDEDTSPSAIFESLESTCAFMTMSINRCLDYMKASSNISLTPSMETFNLKDSLNKPVRCMRHHLQDEDQQRIIVSPIDARICPYVISDNHWFKENVLCLLSNAVKYSDVGTEVNLTISLISEDSIALLLQQQQQEQREEETKQGQGSSMLTSPSAPVATTNNTTTTTTTTTPNKSPQREPGKATATATQQVVRLDQSHSHSQSKVNDIRSSSLILSSTLHTNMYNRQSMEENYTVQGNTNESSPHSVKSTQSVQSIQSRSMIKVAVHDRGVGISDDVRKTLFQPFKQAQRMTGGTGLGLYSLYKRIEALKGLCGIENRDDGLNGSVFWFAFPYRPDYTHTTAELLSRSASLLSLPSTDEKDDDKYCTGPVSVKHTCVTATNHANALTNFDIASLTQYNVTPNHNNNNSGGSSSSSTCFSSNNNQNKVAFTASSKSSTKKLNIMNTDADTNIKDTNNRMSMSMASASAGMSETQVINASNTSHIINNPNPSPNISLTIMDKLPSLRVLLVDDSSSVLKITSRSLRSNGHTVETEVNGSRGLEKLKKSFINQDFDILVTDLQMPVMDGFEFVKRFRAYEKSIESNNTGDINSGSSGVITIDSNIMKRKCSNKKGQFLIIGMSANSDAVSKQEALNAGMDSFISKPFTYQEFVQILSSQFI